jgi:hypothetical protein
MLFIIRIILVVVLFASALILAGLILARSDSKNKKEKSDTPPPNRFTPANSYQNEQIKVSEQIKKEHARHNPAEPPKPTPPTGSPEADAFVSQSKDFITEITSLCSKIEHEKLLDDLFELKAAGTQMYEYIIKHPANARQVAKVTNYYYPTVVKLLTSYNYVRQQQIKVERMNETLAEIETTMDIIVKTFHKYIDGLYSHKAIDVSSEIEVLKHMTKLEGVISENE